MTPIHVAQFPTLRPTGKQVFSAQSLTKDDFIRRLLTHAYVSDKSDIGLYSPVIFRPGCTSRSNSGVQEMSVLVFDVERKLPELTSDDMSALTSSLDQTGFEYVLHSSHSHLPPHKIRLRLVLFPTRHLLAAEISEARIRVMRQLNLEGIVDPATKDLSRMYFWPSAPLGTSPENVVAIHRPGRAVDIDSLLSSFIPVPHEPFAHEPPPGFEYVPAEAPAEINTKPLVAMLKKYSPKDAQSADRARKQNIVYAIAEGKPFATENLNSALWSAVNILAWNLPATTSEAEILAVLAPSLEAMYLRRPGPISYEAALDVARRMIGRAAEARAAEEAWLDAVRNAFFEKADTATSVLLETPPPNTMAEFRELESKLPEIDFVFCIPHERYYLRIGEGWALTSPVRKEGLAGFLSDKGLDEKTLQAVINGRAHPNVYGIDFAPGQPGVFNRNGELFLNAWRPSDLVPAEGEWPSIHRVLESLCTNDTEGPDGETIAKVDLAGKEHLLNWLAFKVQNPGATPGTAVLFNGAPQGSGKNTLAHIMFEILGAANCAKIGTSDLEGRFTSRWAGKCLIFGDEIFQRENVAGLTDRLKDLVTGQTALVEAKGVNAYEVQNRAAFIFASNHLLPIHLEQEDRRWNVFTRHTPVSYEYKCFTQGLFTPENRSTPEFAREIAAFAYFLEHYPVDVRRAKTPYDNMSRRALTSVSMPSHAAFCAWVDEIGIDAVVDDVVRGNQGYVPTAAGRAQIAAELFGEEWDLGPERGVTVAALYRCYQYYCDRVGIDHPYRHTVFGKVLRQHSPAWPDRRCRTAAGRQVQCYAPPRNAVPATVAKPKAPSPEDGTPLANMPYTKE